MLHSLWFHYAGIDDEEMSISEIRRSIERIPFNHREILVHLIVHLQRYFASTRAHMFLLNSGIQL